MNKLSLLGAGLGMVMVLAATLAPVAAQTTSSTSPPRSEGWTPLKSGTTANLRAVSFSDPRVGHIVGEAGTILATADGGKSWKPQFACTGGTSCTGSSKERVVADLTGVGFWNEARGVAVGAGGTILTTANGGKTWTPNPACDRTSACRTSSADHISVDLTAVSVVAPSHAYAVGKAGAMVASDDYGKSWRRLPTCAPSATPHTACEDPSGSGADLAGVDASTAFEVQAVGAGGMIQGTKDGGRTLARQEICVELCTVGIPRSATDLTAVAVPDTRRYFLPLEFAVGDGSAIAIRPLTSNWATRFPCPTSDPCLETSQDRLTADLRAVALPHDSLGFAVGTGGTIVSLDRPPNAPRPGLSARSTPGTSAQWRPMPSGTTQDLSGVSFPTPDVGYTVGASGTVLKLIRSSPGVRVEGLRPKESSTVGGTPVSISGTGFTGAHDVYFGPTRAFGFKVVSDTKITATAPFRPAGAVQVTVATPKGPSIAGPNSRFDYDAPAGGRWSSTSPCPQGCRGPAAVLADGRVLVAGGADSASSAAALYEPSAKTWRAAAHLPVARNGHTITELADGTVLSAGGTTELPLLPPGSPRADTLLKRADIFDSATGAWAPTGGMAGARVSHTATRLEDGKVLVAGGGPSTAELYDPATRTWTAASPMGQVRSDHTATLLPDGRVLVVGGCTETCAGMPASAETYDPRTGVWKTAAVPSVARAAHTATLLGDGSVLIAGGIGTGQTTVPFVERYDPTANRWHAGKPMHAPRALHAATLLDGGRVLITGGVTRTPASESDLGSGPLVPWAEVLDPQTGRWSLVGDMPTPRARHTALLLSSSGCGADCGKVLIAGGDQAPSSLLATKDEKGCYDCAENSAPRPLLYDAAVSFDRTGKAAAERPSRGIIFAVAGGLGVLLASIVLLGQVRRNRRRRTLGIG